MVPLEQRLREEDSGMLCDVDDEDAGMRWRRLLARDPRSCRCVETGAEMYEGGFDTWTGMKSIPTGREVGWKDCK